MEEVTATAVRRAAIDLLARREHSKEELNNKLTVRFGSDPIVHEAIEQLAAEGLQSDERFLSSYIDSRARRLFGPAHIRRELRKRGVDNVAIDIAFAGAGIDWSAVCKELTIKKFGPNPPVGLEEKARRIRFLASRGFLFEDKYS